MPRRYILALLVQCVACSVNAEPTAIIDADSEASERSRIEVSGSRSTVANGSIVAYRWQVEADGELPITIETDSEAMTKIQIGELGDDVQVVLVLTVTGNGGQTATARAQLALNDFDREKLPPNPGQSGRQSLEGVDANNNGVRDDVEIAIYDRYPAEARKREVLHLGALTLQDALIASTTDDDLDEDAAAQQNARVIACLDKVGIENRRAEIAFLKAQVANTSERVAAIENYHALRSGTITPVAEVTEEDCQPQ